MYPQKRLEKSYILGVLWCKKKRTRSKPHKRWFSLEDGGGEGFKSGGVCLVIAVSTGGSGMRDVLQREGQHHTSRFTLYRLRGHGCSWNSQNLNLFLHINNILGAWFLHTLTFPSIVHDVRCAQPGVVHHLGKSRQQWQSWALILRAVATTHAPT